MENSAGPPEESSPRESTTASTGAKAPSRKRRKLLWVSIILIAAIGIGYVIVRTHISPFVHLEDFFADTPLKTMRPHEFEERVARDMIELAGCRDGMAHLRQELAALKTSLPMEASSMKAAQRRQLKDLWAAFLDYQITIDRLAHFYQDFPSVSFWTGSKDEWRHARSFAIAYCLHVMRVGESMQFIDGFFDDRDYEEVLDETDDNHGIPARSYGDMKLRVLHVQTLAEIGIFHQWHKYLRAGHYDPYLKAVPQAADAGMVAEIDQRYPPLKDWYKKEGIKSIAKNAKDILKEDSFRAWFPIQKRVSEWMGDTKVRRTPSLITEEDLDKMRKSLAPGDILLERRNWYLSNAGLPGFWPHAALYIGTLDELVEFYDADPEVREFCQQQAVKGIRALLERDPPRLVEIYRQEAHGHPVRVIEAVSEGVVLNSLEHSCNADYVCVLRPRRRKIDRLQAILVAFTHWEKPYDFNFDFVTQDTIVCSELVYWAYLPDEEKGKRGLDMPLLETLGRRVFPANEFVRLFRDGLGNDGAQLEFIYFLDGVRKDEIAMVRDAKALVDSYTRPKWSLRQK